MPEQKVETEIAVRAPDGPIAQSLIFSDEPEKVVEYATRLAKALAPVIDRQHFYVTMQGKKYVKVEGWNVLGSMLGFTPREVAVTECDDGSYMAVVELISVRSGASMVQASALCGMDERRWKTAERYARRSMAITRATGKAYRMAFSWIVGLAGYEPTAAEEMPYVHDHDDAHQDASDGSDGYDPANRTHQNFLMRQLRLKKVPEDRWDDVGNALKGRPASDLEAVLKQTLGAKN